MRKVKAYLERGSDGSYGVYVDLDNKTLNYGIHGVGETSKEAISDFMDGYQEMKELYQEEGNHFVEAEFEIKYDIPSFLNYYKGLLSLAGLEKITGVNQRQLSHYINGTNRPSKQTTEKIVKALHRFADELRQVDFS